MHGWHGQRNAEFSLTLLMHCEQTNLQCGCTHAPMPNLKEATFGLAKQHLVLEFNGMIGPPFVGLGSALLVVGSHGMLDVFGGGAWPCGIVRGCRTTIPTFEPRL